MCVRGGPPGHLEVSSRGVRTSRMAKGNDLLSQQTPRRASQGLNLRTPRRIPGQEQKQSRSTSPVTPQSQRQLAPRTFNSPTGCPRSLGSPNVGTCRAGSRQLAACGSPSTRNSTKALSSPCSSQPSSSRPTPLASPRRLPMSASGPLRAGPARRQTAPRVPPTASSDDLLHAHCSRAVSSQLYRKGSIALASFSPRRQESPSSPQITPRPLRYFSSGHVPGIAEDLRKQRPGVGEGFLQHLRQDSSLLDARTRKAMSLDCAALIPSELQSSMWLAFSCWCVQGYPAHPDRLSQGRWLKLLRQCLSEKHVVPARAVSSDGRLEEVIAMIIFQQALRHSSAAAGNGLCFSDFARALVAVALRVWPQESLETSFECLARRLAKSLPQLDREEQDEFIKREDVQRILVANSKFVEGLFAKFSNAYSSRRVGAPRMKAHAPSRHLTRSESCEGTTVASTECTGVDESTTQTPLTCRSLASSSSTDSLVSAASGWSMESFVQCPADPSSPSPEGIHARLSQAWKSSVPVAESPRPLRPVPPQQASQEVLSSRRPSRAQTPKGATASARSLTPSISKCHLMRGGVSYDDFMYMCRSFGIIGNLLTKTETVCIFCLAKASVGHSCSYLPLDGFKGVLCMLAASCFKKDPYASMYPDPPQRMQAFLAKLRIGPLRSAH
mmetsp:Transcript_46760/g.109062  ORF Transcript_46760/g.109062 Transcript_46760/m.109062 type:complete len:670 (+) Transcript_46760:59-2068(+)